MRQKIVVQCPVVTRRVTMLMPAIWPMSSSTLHKTGTHEAAAVDETTGKTKTGMNMHRPASAAVGSGSPTTTIGASKEVADVVMEKVADPDQAADIRVIPHANGPHPWT